MARQRPFQVSSFPSPRPGKTGINPFRKITLREEPAKTYSFSHKNGMKIRISDVPAKMLYQDPKKGSFRRTVNDFNAKDSKQSSPFMSFSPEQSDFTQDKEFNQPVPQKIQDKQFEQAARVWAEKQRKIDEAFEKENQMKEKERNSFWNRFKHFRVNPVGTSGFERTHGINKRGVR